MTVQELGKSANLPVFFFSKEHENKNMNLIF